VNERAKINIVNEVPFLVGIRIRIVKKIYGKSFVTPGAPRIGHEVEFTRFPPADRGDLDRAIEIANRQAHPKWPDHSRVWHGRDKINAAIRPATKLASLVNYSYNGRAALLRPAALRWVE
jgi:hypothetical protein